MGLSWLNCLAEFHNDAPCSLDFYYGHPYSSVLWPENNLKSSLEDFYGDIEWQLSKFKAYHKFYGLYPFTEWLHSPILSHHFLEWNPIHFWPSVESTFPISCFEKVFSRVKQHARGNNKTPMKETDCKKGGPNYTSLREFFAHRH